MAKLLMDPNKIRISNCLFISLFLKIINPKSKIYSKDLHYQRLVYKALSKDKEPINKLTRHYFIRIPNDEFEADYIYEFVSIKKCIKIPILFKGKVEIRYADDAINRYLYTLVWAMKKLDYKWDDIEKEILNYERKWNIKSTLGNFLVRGIKESELDTYKEFFPGLIKDLEDINMSVKLLQ